MTRETDSLINSGTIDHAGAWSHGEKEPTTMAYPNLYTPRQLPALAVTYFCANGHTEIRFWRDYEIPRAIVCPACRAEAIIMPEEMERHALMMSTLSSRLQ